MNPQVACPSEKSYARVAETGRLKLPWFIGAPSGRGQKRRASTFSLMQPSGTKQADSVGNVSSKLHLHLNCPTHEIPVQDQIHFSSSITSFCSSLFRTPWVTLPMSCRQSSTFILVHQRLPFRIRNAAYVLRGSPSCGTKHDDSNATFPTARDIADSQDPVRVSTTRLSHTPLRVRTHVLRLA